MRRSARPNPATITGNVLESAKGQYFGRGQLDGTLTIDPAQAAQADKDASSASAQAAALTPTQTFKSIRHATTIQGNGGVNVIDINGNIRASLTLKGSVNDVFIINVKGSMDLFGRSSLGLAGGVTANHVLYNFTGRHGDVVAFHRGEIDGTLLAPRYNVFLDGTVNGEVIGGGRHFVLLPGAKVNQESFTPSATCYCKSMTARSAAWRRPPEGGGGWRFPPTTTRPSFGSRARANRRRTPAPWSRAPWRSTSSYSGSRSAT